MNADEITKHHRDMINEELTPVAFRAREVSDLATAAFWADKPREYLVTQIVTQFHILADALGYELTLKDEFKPQPTGMEAKE